MKTLIRLLLITALCAPSYSADTRIVDRINLLSEFHFEQGASAFFNYKNDELREMYFVTANTEFEAMIVSVDKEYHVGILFNNYLGMGKQSATITFDPRDAHYAIVPFFEFRHKNVFYQTGLDHRCFHEIDRMSRPISPYWNEVYVKALSANYRFKTMKEKYIDEGRDGIVDNLKWHAQAGYFVRKMGKMDKTLLSGGHPWGGTAGVNIGYSFYKTNSWIFSARNDLTAFVDNAWTPYWAGDFGIDADVYNRQYSVGFFINYNYEFPRMLPLYSKDQLFEWGVRFRF
jgi:hypothetical protein